VAQNAYYKYSEHGQGIKAENDKIQTEKKTETLKVETEKSSI
jgi:hypothetical protein